MGHLPKLIEDLALILIVVFLSTVAVTQQFEGSEMVFTKLKLLFFLALWFIAGIFFCCQRYLKKPNLCSTTKPCWYFPSGFA